MADFTPKMLTASQLAERWQLDPGTVYRMCARGELPHVRIGKLFRIPVAHVERVERGEEPLHPASDETAARAAPAPADGRSPRPVPEIPFDPARRARQIVAGLKRS